MNTELKRIIQEYLDTTNGLKYNNMPKQDFWNDLVNATSYLPDTFLPARRYWHLKHDCHKLNPSCPVCGKDVKFVRNTYNKTCSAKCHIHRCMPNRMATNRKKYGGNAPACSKEVVNKMSSTTLKNHGVSNISSLSRTKEKKKQKSIEKYGVDNVSKSPEVIEKIRQNKINLTDEEQRSIYEKAMKTSKQKPKLYCLPSGIEVYVQGFEPWALDILLKTHTEDDLLIGRKTPVVHYKFEGFPKRHYPDIYIKSLNKLVEVKSIFTYSRYKAINDAKIEAAINSGFLYEFWVFDEKQNLTII